MKKGNTCPVIIRLIEDKKKRKTKNTDYYSIMVKFILSW